jgi:hypothetical protein
LLVAGGILETGLSLGQVFGRTGSQAEQELTFTPVGNTGNYFLRQERRAERAQWLETFTAAPASGHHFKFGGTLTRTRVHGAQEARAVNVHDLEGLLRRRIEYENQPPFRLAEWETGLFVHDRWVLGPRLSLDAGLRADWQQLAAVWRVAPRLGLAWSPFGDSATVARAGLGWFSDRVPMNVHAFDRFPAPRGGINTIEKALAPRSRNWSLQLDRRIGGVLLLRAGYLDSSSHELPVLEPKDNTIALTAAGRGRYRHVELISRLSWEEGQELFFSYVHSRSRNNLNDFAEFLGDFPVPLLRRDVHATAPGNIPHRLLAWGVVPVRKNWKVAPVIEFRTGFPYSALDAAQQYAGVPNGRSFPNFFSLDFRVARDIRYRGHGFQVSFSMFNVTNHWNPDTVRWNITDPQFGEFLGQHRRRYRLDFDFLY